MSNISANIKSIRDIMRKDTGVDGDAQRISQMVWMIFMKIFSDNEENWSKGIKNYKNPIPSELQWHKWTSDNNGLSGSDLIKFINEKLFPGLKALNPEQDEQSKIIKSVFEDTYNYMRNGVLFRQVIDEINKIKFNEPNSSHLFNDIYENILKELQSAGSSGEFYTPRAVTQFMVDIIKPKPNESILDPACGTGGFLTCSIDNLKEDQQIFNKQHLIMGVEKKPLPHLLCITNLMLHGFSSPNIHRDNLLQKPFEDWRAEDKVDVILSNPPFGGTEEDGTENNFPSNFKTKETADLFIVLILKLLKRGGRAAVILPDSFLYGEGVRTTIKQELLDHANLHTIVRLPNGIFNPYTSIKTNILFFEKGRSTKEIWYFEHPFPQGFKSYTKSRPVNLKEFDIEKKWWNERVENDHAWKVSISDIKKRKYNLDISSPYFGESDDEVSTEDLLLDLDRSIKKSQELMTLLKSKFN